MFQLEPRPYLLDNPIRPYPWGERGPGAFLPRLLGVPADPDQPFAELWIGAHENAPSRIVADGGSIPLSEAVRAFPEQLLGQAAERFAGQFPFLLKILSAAEPLSIQAHPDRLWAQRLHRRDPQHYPDGNAKPELVYVLDELEVLIGFRPWPAVMERLQRTPELAQAAGLTLGQAEQAGLEGFYRHLVQGALRQPLVLARALDELARRLQALTPEERDAEETLFLQLQKRYPADIGLASLFLLNRLRLSAGETLFTGPGLPHAYLRGNIIECMSNSDNVVRAGLTTKFTDLRALLDVVDVLAAPLFPLPQAGPWGGREIPCPAQEFQLFVWETEEGFVQRLDYGERPLVLLCTRGEFTLEWAGGQLRCAQGRAALAPACLRGVQLATCSSCQIFGVTSPW